jgi:parvulin-like peptidyl-prolyl isomerase
MEELQKVIEQGSGEPWPRVDQRVATRLFDQLLHRRVLLQVASERRPELLHGGQVSLEALVEALCPPPEPPDPATVERRLREEARLQLPTRARVRQLLLRSEARAEEARQRLMDGEPFVELSAQLSSAPNAAEGGGLGTVAEGDLPPEFDEAIFALETGGISEPVQGPAGYHIFQVIKRFEGGEQDRDAVRQQLVRRLRQEAERRAFGRCLETLAAELGVDVFEQHLWFRYDGRYVEASDERSSANE